MQLAAVRKSSKLDKVFQAAFKGAVLGVFGSLIGSLGAIITAAVTRGTKSIFEFTKANKEIFVIGETKKGINETISEGEYNLEMKVPKNIEVEYPEMTDQDVRYNK